MFRLIAELGSCDVVCSAAAHAGTVCDEGRLRSADHEP